MASLHNHPKVVSYLLDQGAAPDIKDAWGCTPLHNAAGKGLLEIVELLVYHGADLNIR